jgi:hypothetical protein
MFLEKKPNFNSNPNSHANPNTNPNTDLSYLIARWYVEQIVGRPMSLERKTQSLVFLDNIIRLWSTSCYTLYYSVERERVREGVRERE